MNTADLLITFKELNRVNEEYLEARKKYEETKKKILRDNPKLKILGPHIEAQLPTWGASKKLDGYLSTVFNDIDNLQNHLKKIDYNIGKTLSSNRENPVMFKLFKYDDKWKYETLEDVWYDDLRGGSYFKEPRIAKETYSTREEAEDALLQHLYINHKRYYL